METLEVVPWRNVDEWLSVKEDICSGDVVRLINATTSLSVWKGRARSLPIAIECTLILTYVYTKDSEGPVTDEIDLAMMYSTSIIRFLNFTLGTQDRDTRTMYQQADAVSIPSWIVQLRHDISHGLSIPSLSVLRMATKNLLEWIIEQYWEPESRIMLTKKQYSRFDIITNIFDLNFYIHRKLKEDLELSYEEIQPGFKEDWKNVLNILKTRNPDFPEGNLREIKRQLIREIWCYLVEESAHRFLDHVLVPDGFFLDEQFLLDRDGNLKPDELFQVRGQFLEAVFITYNFPYFLQRIIDISGDDSYIPAKRRLAAIWAKQLLDDLIRVNTMKTISVSKKLVAISKRRRMSYDLAIFDNLIDIEKHYCSVPIDFEVKRIASDLRSILKSALLKPHQYTSIFIEQLFMVQINNKFSERKKNKLLDLMNKMLAKKSGQQEFQTDLPVYTIEFLPNVKDGNSSQSSDQTAATNIENNLKFKFVLEGKSAWSKCPLGTSPK